MTPEQLLGKYLRELRLSRGWTLEELSYRSGPHNAHLSHIENGKRGITVKVLCKLSNAFGISPGTILRESGYLNKIKSI